jgi:hypothetical protein
MSPRDSKRDAEPEGRKPPPPDDDADLEYENYYGDAPGEPEDHAEPAAEHGTSDAPRMREPKGYPLSDKRIHAEICERLSRPPSRFDATEVDLERHDASAVTIEVDCGKVTLRGTVPEPRTKRYIEELVDACPGVQDIDNRISIVR